MWATFLYRRICINCDYIRGVGHRAKKKYYHLLPVLKQNLGDHKFKNDRTVENVVTRNQIKKGHGLLSTGIRNVLPTIWHMPAVAGSMWEGTRLAAHLNLCWPISDESKGPKTYTFKHNFWLTVVLCWTSMTLKIHQVPPASGQRCKLCEEKCYKWRKGSTETATVSETVWTNSRWNLVL